MTWSDRYINFIRKALPSPFGIAIVLTAVVILWAGTVTNYSFREQVGFWNTGLWELLAFAMQMMLMLVLGHALALSKLASNALTYLLNYCNTSSSAVLTITLVSLLTGYFNWGLGLIIGAILAKKIAEHASRNEIPVNYPLIATCGYLGLMVWHAGVSGSAPLTVTKAGHSLEQEIGVISAQFTTFSTFNIAAFGMIMVVLPAAAWWLNKQSKQSLLPALELDVTETLEVEPELTGAEKMDHSIWVGRSVGGLMILVLIITCYPKGVWELFSINNINLLLFGLALMAAGSFKQFIASLNTAISSSTGILIQFPLYAGIMGVMKYSGLADQIATSFIAVSSTHTFPLFAMLSSAFVNILVPSGGGQWQVQGPILVETAQQLGYPIPKTIMALAYGDQLTNMLQPFWALPLLGITGLKVKDILPYSFLFMLIGFVIYLVALIWL
jgi:short-chain fatty acids transporter